MFAITTRDSSPIVMKKLGQHFLKDVGALKKIAAALEIEPGDTVVEIGSGHGELTQQIKNEYAGIKIVGIEKDGRLAAALRKKFAADKNVQIIERDALKVLAAIVSRLAAHKSRYAICGNIPYYITGRLLRIIGELEPKPKRCVFTVQKEVAERLTATPPKMNRLAAAVGFWAKPTIISLLPKTYFRPPPKVDSAIVLLKPEKISNQTKPGDYYQMVKILFRQPRKTLWNNLRAAGLEPETITKNLKEAGLSPNLRPHNLGLESILNLVDGFSDVLGV